MALRLEEFEAKWGKRYNWPSLAAGVRLRHAVFRLPTRYPQDNLNAFEAALIIAQHHQDPRQLSPRRSRTEALVPRDQICRPALATPDRMDRRHGPV